MYSIFKKIFNSLFPGFARKYEFTIRKLLGLFYIGNNVHCNICGSTLKRFIQLENSDLICPACGSLGRHRRLWMIVTEKGPFNKTDFILHFSPSKILQKKFKALYSNYVTTDFSGNLNTDKSYDITSIKESDNSYDVIICYHVLEHIIEDRKAISELYRILKSGGQLILQTPFKKGDIYEDFSITTNKDRKKYFGQEDHVRVYSVQGLKSRVEKELFKVEVLSFNEFPDNKNGYKVDESILLCTK
jgi:SAM-dependent methyltransferase